MLNIVDIVKMYSTMEEKTLVEIVRNKVEKKDVNWFNETINGVQRGMAIAAKNKMNTEEFCKWYAWLLRFLEKSRRQIILQYEKPKTLKEKRELENNLEIFARRKSY